MKKLFFFVVLVVMSLSLVACNSGSTSSYSLLQKDQGNVSTAWTAIQCVSDAGSNVQAAANCVKP